MVGSSNSKRRRWLSVLASASASELEQRWAAFDEKPAWQAVRPAETGMVMLRARTGGTGAPFNMAEMTVTRCAVRLTNGGVGYGYVQGRQPRQAELAAVIDAMLQEGAQGERLEAEIIGPLETTQADRRRMRLRKAAATAVEFFTLVRGD